MSNTFPRWTNRIPTAAAIITPFALAGICAAVWYWFSPRYTDVGYRPVQPVPFSHRQHAGELGMDCRYCHNTVERAARAAVPPAATCLNCHRIVKTDSESIQLIAKSADGGESLKWVRVHQLPDYAYFDHHVHLASGVGCATCHGRIDQMERVRLWAPLSMSWCLDCHRQPGPALRPVSEITNMAFSPAAAGYHWRDDPLRLRQPHPPENCSGCHR